MEWDKEAAALSEAHAKEELEKAQEGMSPEQLQGAIELAEWINKWVAGHNKTEHGTSWKALSQIAVKVILNK